MMIFYKSKKIESLIFIQQCVGKFCDAKKILFEDIIIKKNEKGKPICVSPTGIYVSLSHCDLSLKKKRRVKSILPEKAEDNNEFFTFCAVGLVPIGIDVEFVTDIDYSLIKNRCNLKNITTTNSFFANWVFAEAYYKMSNEHNMTLLGLLSGLKGFLPPMAFDDNLQLPFVTRIESKDWEEYGFNIDIENNCLTALRCSCNLPNCLPHKDSSNQSCGANSVDCQMKKNKFFNSLNAIHAEVCKNIGVKDKALAKFYKLDDVLICVVFASVQQ